ncbi:Homeobox transcription factor [Penicillium ucsense]|uniref:Homeobox transcription factor n=1 Tax=Penicillium ucsense TaxID=2839758 RepID=A0A8J8W733_9EURO|nr:Homeobox transcription factor [Penicillium ucsense]KAF7736838.1 Homeobox transcription factor [Penicillium ucsense]
MSYIHPSWNYQAHPGVPMDHAMAYDPTMIPPPMMHHHPVDGYLYPHPPTEMLDYYHQPIMDYDEYAENLSRPRLTKEQVETLEAQFQAHPKPSSNVKRQLAAQTNLSLPRVANWFQNRRAKAKQQKRQEEYEKMQKAKAEAEEAVRQKSNSTDQAYSEPHEETATDREVSEGSSTPQAEDSDATINASTTENSKDDGKTKKHQKTKSETAREATLASLQRALNAACAARDRFTGRKDAKADSTQKELSESPAAMGPPMQQSKSQESNEQTTYANGYGELSNEKESTSWHSAHRQGGSKASQRMSEASRSVPVDLNGFHRMQYASPSEDWSEHSQGQISDHANLDFSGMQYQGSIQTPAISITRRESTDALAILDGIGIHTGDSGMHQPSVAAAAASWRESGKELDLAARRKRPRPAAIGTAPSRSLNPSTSMSSLSPTDRDAGSLGAGHSMRHTKSAQSLNTRYAGVRKSSAVQRSPLNFTFAESGSMKASKAHMLRPSVSAASLAPPTPLTPQDFQHFLPASPTDSSYCVSAHSRTNFFPTSQPMQINLASPPATPLDIYAPFAYQNVAPPMSAPAQVSAFPEYMSCDSMPLTARSWVDTGSIASPVFPNGLAVPSSASASPAGFDTTIDQSGHGFRMDTASVSPPLMYSIEDTDLSGSLDSGTGKQPSFMMSDYQQHDTRMASQHVEYEMPMRPFAITSNPSSGQYAS